MPPNALKIMEDHHICLVRLITSIIIITTGPFICGISLGFSSTVSAQLLIGDNLIAFFSSVINLGALAGSLTIGPLLNTLGRRAALRISAVPSILGWLLITSAKGLSLPSTVVEPRLFFFLIIGRVLSGLAAGMMTAVGSVYLVELAPPHQSGRIGSLAQVAIVAGTCFVYYCGMVATWHETAALVVILSTILFGATFYLPESPAWLIKRNQFQAALRDLTWLRSEKVAAQELSELCPDSSDHGKASPQHRRLSGQEASRSREFGSAPASRLVRLLFPCVTIPPELSSNLRIALALMVAQQATGINVVTFYTEPLCQRMVHVRHSARCAFGLGLAQLLFSLLASFLIIDRLPRRRLVVITGAIMATSMFFFALGQKSSSTMSSLALVTFLLGFQCGWGPLAMLVSMELFPPQHRGAVGSAAVSTNWVVSFIVTQTFKPLVNALQGFGPASSAPSSAEAAGGRGNGVGETIVFLFYSVTTAFTTTYFYHRLPETNRAFQV